MQKVMRERREDIRRQRRAKAMSPTGSRHDTQLFAQARIDVRKEEANDCPTADAKRAKCIGICSLKLTTFAQASLT